MRSVLGSLVRAHFLLLALVGQTRAIEPQPVYLKVELHEDHIDFTNSGQRLKETGEAIITAMIKDHHVRYFSWQLEAKEPSDTKHYPELRVIVRTNDALDNWDMEVALTMDAEAVAARKTLKVESLLPRGAIIDRTFPTGTGRLLKVREWFLEHFVKPSHKDSLRNLMWMYVPLGKGHLALKANPPLQQGEGLLLLPYKSFWHLGNCQFRVVFAQQGQVVEKVPFRGKGYREISVGHVTVQVLWIEYEKDPTDLGNLKEGRVYLQEYREASPTITIAN